MQLAIKLSLILWYVTSATIIVGDPDIPWQSRHSCYLAFPMCRLTACCLCYHTSRIMEAFVVHMYIYVLYQHGFCCANVQMLHITLKQV
jgi:hypothetical protein